MILMLPYLESSSSTAELYRAHTAGSDSCCLCLFLCAQPCSSLLFGIIELNADKCVLIPSALSDMHG